MGHNAEQTRGIWPAGQQHIMRFKGDLVRRICGVGAEQDNGNAAHGSTGVPLPLPGQSRLQGISSAYDILLISSQSHLAWIGLAESP